MVLFGQTDISESYSQMKHLMTTLRGDPDSAGIPESNTFSSSDDFFDWLDESLISDVFTDPACGDGVCSGTGNDYQSFDRFGCKTDCGTWPNVTKYYLHVGGMFESESQATYSGFNVCPKGALDSRGCHFVKFYQPLQVPIGKTEDEKRTIATNSKTYWENIYQKEFKCSYRDWSDNNFGGTCSGFGAVPICRWSTCEKERDVSLAFVPRQKDGTLTTDHGKRLCCDAALAMTGYDYLENAGVVEKSFTGKGDAGSLDPAAGMGGDSDNCHTHYTQSACDMDGGCAWYEIAGAGSCVSDATRRRLTKAEKQDIRRRLETKTKTPKYTDKDFPGTYLDYP